MFGILVTLIQYMWSISELPIFCTFLDVHHQWLTKTKKCRNRKDKLMHSEFFFLLEYFALYKNIIGYIPSSYCGVTYRSMNKNADLMAAHDLTWTDPTYQSATPATKHAVRFYFLTRKVVLPWTELHDLWRDHSSNSCRKRLKNGDNRPILNLAPPH